MLCQSSKPEKEYEHVQSLGSWEVPKAISKIEKEREVLVHQCGMAKKFIYFLTTSVKLFYGSSSMQLLRTLHSASSQLLIDSTLCLSVFDG